MKPLMVSRQFLASHKSAGLPTNFPGKIQRGEKIHTLRGNEKNYFKDGDLVSIREWTGKPRRSEQKEILQVVIGIEPVVLLASLNEGIQAFVGETEVDPTVLARNDGLCLLDFAYWFFPEHPRGNQVLEWRGDILHFTPLRYAKGNGVFDPVMQKVGAA